MALECSCALERLVGICQVVAGQAIEWYELPADNILWFRFSEIPAPGSYVEAIAIAHVLADFARRLGRSVHENFHRRYAGPLCDLAQPSISSVDCVHANVAAVLHEWIRRYRRAFDSAHDTSAHRARQYLEEHFASPLTAATVARAVHAETRTLDRQFRSVFGVSLIEYRTRLRVVEAVQQLRAGVKAESVAAHVGWRARKDLYRALRRLTGELPSNVSGLPDVRVRSLLAGLRPGGVAKSI